MKPPQQVQEASVGQAFLMLPLLATFSCVCRFCQTRPDPSQMLFKQDKTYDFDAHFARVRCSHPQSLNVISGWTDRDGSLLYLEPYGGSNEYPAYSPKI